MQGIEQAYADMAISSALSANLGLMMTRVIEAVTNVPAYGKGDTLGLDAIPEIAYHAALKQFDREAILITEELGGQLKERLRKNRVPTTFFCDPTDRSGSLRQFLEAASAAKPQLSVGEALAEPNVLKRWEADHSGPCSITGAVSAITCVRAGLPIFSVILNFVTQEIILACNAGIRLLKLPPYESPKYKEVNADHIMRVGRELRFTALQERMQRFSDGQNYVTFLKKKGYEENFRDSAIFPEGYKTEPIYDNPGGPTRALYLSDLYVHPPIGFILANGEKVTEWMHWLAALRFARHSGEPSLRLFEIWHERPSTRDGVSLAPSPIYSIFQEGTATGLSRIDIRMLCMFQRPSQYRGTLVLAPADNAWLSRKMRAGSFREIVFDAHR